MCAVPPNAAALIFESAQKSAATATAYPRALASPPKPMPSNTHAHAHTHTHTHTQRNRTPPVLSPARPSVLDPDLMDVDPAVMAFSRRASVILHRGEKPQAGVVGAELCAATLAESLSGLLRAQESGAVQRPQQTRSGAVADNGQHDDSNSSSSSRTTSPRDGDATVTSSLAASTAAAGASRSPGGNRHLNEAAMAGVGGQIQAAGGSSSIVSDSHDHTRLDRSASESFLGTTNKPTDVAALNTSKLHQSLSMKHTRPRDSHPPNKTADTHSTVGKATASVLIVDDSTANRKMLERMLKMSNICPAPEQAADGAIALARIQALIANDKAAGWLPLADIMNRRKSLFPGLRRNSLSDHDALCDLSDSAGSGSAAGVGVANPGGSVATAGDTGSGAIGDDAGSNAVVSPPKRRRSLLALARVLAGADVLASPSAAGATTARVPSSCPDVILMDFVMPNMSGPAATEKIRSEGYEGLIVGVTGNALSEDIDFFIKSGADAVLTKPIDIAQLQEMVAAKENYRRERLKRTMGL